MRRPACLVTKGEDNVGGNLGGSVCIFINCDLYNLPFFSNSGGMIKVYRANLHIFAMQA